MLLRFTRFVSHAWVTLPGKYRHANIALNLNGFARPFGGAGGSRHMGLARRIMKAAAIAAFFCIALTGTAVTRSSPTLNAACRALR
jgi:hypothetical protein